MKIKLLQIAILAGVSAGCKAERHASPRVINQVELERRTVEFTQKEDADINRRMQQWQEDGWAINSFSARLPQPDGTIHRRAELSRAARPGASFAYDDRRIARITLGETTEDELVDWFGHPESRVWNRDRLMSLSWSFSPSDAHSQHGFGMLNVILGPEGTVESYQAKRAKELVGSDSNGSGFRYDDKVIARIGQSQTSESQLLEWFGQPIEREKTDRTTHLAWQFAKNSGIPASGTLNVILSADGKVDSYAARRSVK